jgi:hypothetical protein
MAKKPGVICAGLRGSPTLGGTREAIEDQERRLIVQAVKRGGTAAEIAATFGRSSKAVRKIAKQEGLRLARNTAAKKFVSMAVRLPAVVHAALAAAAKRRSTPAEEIAVGLIAGTLMRGNIEGTLNGGGYSFVRQNARPAEAGTAGLKPD